jgi:hypothetical protein
MRRQGIRLAARALFIARGARDTNDLLCKAVVGLQLAVLERPIGSHAERAVHLHRPRVEAMRFTVEVQGRAADAAYMVVSVCPTPVALDHRTTLPVPGTKVPPARLERLHRSEGVPAL